MTNEGSAPGTVDRDGGARARGELVEFLNGNRPAMLVADSLEYLLRTEPPATVELEEVVELVAAWADERAAVTSEATSVLLLGALRRVLEAHEEVHLDGFDPDRFVATVGEALTRHCPSSEVGGYQSGLGSLVGAKPADVPPAPAAPGEDAVEIRGVRMAVRDAQEAAVSRLEHEAYMTDDDFALAYDDLERAFVSRAGSNIYGLLARTTRASAKIFNTGRAHQAARVVDLVNALFERLAISPEGRREVAYSVGPSELNEGLLARLLNDPAHRADAAALVRTYGYLKPSEALQTLALENRRERRRLLLAAVEANGAEGYSAILDQLAVSSAGQKWYATRNSLYLLSRVEAPDEASRKRAVEAAGRFVANDQPQVRSAAIAALRRIGGRDVIPFVVRALDPGAYAPGSIDDSDALRRHLGAALETLVETGNEAAVAIAAEFATGARGSEFDLGPSLRDEACAALTHHKGPLPRRAALVIASHLGSVCGRRFKLVTGRLSFGLDVHACQMLSTLIKSSPEPECREALEHPVLVKVLARTTGDLA